MIPKYESQIWALKKTIDDLNEEIQNRDKAALDAMIATPENLEASLHKWTSEFEGVKDIRVADELQTLWSKPAPTTNPLHIIAKTAALTFSVCMVAILALLNRI